MVRIRTCIVVTLLTVIAIWLNPKLDNTSFEVLSDILTVGMMFLTALVWVLPHDEQG